MTKNKLIVILQTAIFSLLLISCEKSAETVKIDGLEWMTTNLAATQFRNGDQIPEAKTNEEWYAAGENGQPAWCYFENKPENGKTYGVLYNWFAVSDPRGIAPEGWHVATNQEWSQITEKFGGEDDAGKAFKSMDDWKEHTHASDSSGLNCMAGGRRDYTGKFFNIGIDGYWWCQDQYDERDAWGRNLNYLYPSVQSEYFNKYFGFSVRCVKD